MISKFHLIIGDCRIEMKQIKADYMFTVPPDFDEIDLNPKTSKGYADYFHFLTQSLDMSMLSCPIITIAITDRKCDSMIISKHAFILRLFKSRGWTLLSHKIWAKTTKRNLYRLGYTHIMSFSKKRRVKQNHPKAYELDVFFAKEQKFRNYSYGINEEILHPFIENFTEEGQTILDPFLGSGTTAVAAIDFNRKCVGIEIDPEVASLAVQRVKEREGVPRARKFFEEGENFALPEV